MNYLQAAEKIAAEIIANRRTFHSFAETGFDLPKTTALVEKTLTSYGLRPERVGKSGITACIGSGKPVLLLRADMDALPMEEQTGLLFGAENGNCHSCGHDTHTAMLLGAAKLLKDSEASLCGTVKLMFQPAEEQLAGALDMIEAGILENPQVDAAIGMHIMAGQEGSDKGTITYSRGPAMYSGDAVTIRVTGRDAHGSTPFKGVDAITIASQIVLASQTIIAREIPCDENAVVLIGKLEAGTTCNTVAGAAVLEASIRAQTEEMRTFLKNRLREVAQSVAATYGGSAAVEFVYGMPPLVNDSALAEEVAASCGALLGADRVCEVGPQHGSEDFTAVAAKVPSVMLYLGGGSQSEGYEYGMHHPKMVVDEQVLYKGSALYAHCAERYLAAHAE